MTSNQIKFFSSNLPYFEFSNYFQNLIEIDNIKWNSNEHYYQSQKFNYDDGIEYYNLMKYCDSPQKAKDMGNQKINPRGNKWLISKEKPELGLVSDAIIKYKNVKIRQNWEEIKNDIMYKVVYEKFCKNNKLKNLLLDTNNKEIIENSPYDSYWGIANNGKNILGKILMQVREELKKNNN